MNDDQVSTPYARKVGERLRAVRKQKRLSLQAVEQTSTQEFKASVLGAYERGERAISVPRLQRLARFYDVPVDQLLPRDLADAAWGPVDPPGQAPPAARAGGQAMVAGGRQLVANDNRDDGTEGGRITIDLTKINEIDVPERDLLRRYLAMIQVQRQDFNGRMLTIRDDDIRAIACLFDLSSEGMRRRLEELGLRLQV